MVDWQTGNKKFWIKLISLVVVEVFLFTSLDWPFAKNTAYAQPTEQLAPQLLTSEKHTERQKSAKVEVIVDFILLSLSEEGATARVVLEKTKNLFPDIELYYEMECPLDAESLPDYLFTAVIESTYYEIRISSKDTIKRTVNELSYEEFKSRLTSKGLIRFGAESQVAIKIADESEAPKATQPLDDSAMSATPAQEVIVESPQTPVSLSSGVFGLEVTARDQGVTIEQPLVISKHDIEALPSANALEEGERVHSILLTLVWESLNEAWEEKAVARIIGWGTLWLLSMVSFGLAEELSQAGLAHILGLETRNVREFYKGSIDIHGPPKKVVIAKLLGPLIGAVTLPLFLIVMFSIFNIHVDLPLWLRLSGVFVYLGFNIANIISAFLPGGDFSGIIIRRRTRRAFYDELPQGENWQKWQRVRKILERMLLEALDDKSLNTVLRGYTKQFKADRAKLTFKRHLEMRRAIEARTGEDKYGGLRLRHDAMIAESHIWMLISALVDRLEILGIRELKEYLKKKKEDVYEVAYKLHGSLDDEWILGLFRAESKVLNNFSTSADGEGDARLVAAYRRYRASERFVKGQYFDALMKAIDDALEDGIDHPKLPYLAHKVEEVVEENPFAKILIVGYQNTTVDKIRDALEKRGLLDSDEETGPDIRIVTSMMAQRVLI